MKWDELEKCFNRAWLSSFSKKKVLWVFPVLVLCGILIVFCRALAFDASEWVAMSLTFLPFFLTSGILMSLGILLIRVYHNEVKHLKMSYRKMLRASWQVIVGTSYLSIPPLLGYLLLWIILGIFVLLREIPGVGGFVAVVLAFAPFLLILCSILLVFLNFGLLFFVSPAVAIRPVEKLRLAQGVLTQFKKNIFSNLLLFIVAILPLFFVAGVLALAAILTGLSYVVANHPLSIALQWFFIMLPFCAIMTPAVIFFFNFAAESYYLVQKD